MFSYSFFLPLLVSAPDFLFLHFNITNGLDTVFTFFPFDFPFGSFSFVMSSSTMEFDGLSSGFAISLDLQSVNESSEHEGFSLLNVHCSMEDASCACCGGNGTAVSVMSFIAFSSGNELLVWLSCNDTVNTLKNNLMSWKHYPGFKKLGPDMKSDTFTHSRPSHLQNN